MAQWTCENLPWTKLGSVIISLPVIGLTFCVIYSLLYDFEATTKTHGCLAYNFLPSISAASGDREPQLSVWWWCIVLHTPGRYFISLRYITFYHSVPGAQWIRFYGPLALGCVLVNVLEVTALLTLTLYSSKENFEVHAASFGTFIFCSLLYMVSVIYIQKSLNKDITFPKLSSSIKYKKVLFVANGLSVAASMYLYWRHNAYCESGVYSFFALSEYFMVLTNVAFHSTFMMDFASKVDSSPAVIA